MKSGFCKNYKALLSAVFLSCGMPHCDGALSDKSKIPEQPSFLEQVKRSVTQKVENTVDAAEQAFDTTKKTIQGAVLQVVETVTDAKDKLSSINPLSDELERKKSDAKLRIKKLGQDNRKNLYEELDKGKKAVEERLDEVAKNFKADSKFCVEKGLQQIDNCNSEQEINDVIRRFHESFSVLILYPEILELQIKTQPLQKILDLTQPKKLETPTPVQTTEENPLSEQIPRP